MGHDDHFIYLGRLKSINSVDRNLEEITYGFLGSVVKEVGREIKKGFYYLIGKSSKDKKEVKARRLKPLALDYSFWKKI